jgi:tetratricopeptide (TPR) repeat protein
MSTQSQSYQRARAIVLFLVIAIIGYIAAFSFPFDRFALSLSPEPTLKSYIVKVRQQEADLVQTELAAAKLAQQAGQTDQAIDLYRKALAVAPTAQIYTQLITILVAVDSIPQAAIVLGEAIARFPADANLLQLQTDVQSNQ